MREDDRQHPIDDDCQHRAADAEPRGQQAPVIRVLANPRRVRRA